MEHLDQQPQSRLLDVGPVCQENIRFFASRVWKHYVCDMFIRLDRYIRKGDPVYQIWKELDYHPESFDGILVWELADRLDEQDVNRLVTLCHSMLKPGGMAVVMVMGDQIASSETKSFVVGQNYRIYLRPQPHLEPAVTGSPEQRRIVHDGAVYSGQILHLPSWFYGIPLPARITRPGFGTSI